jgi:hypothetical protein
MLRMPTGSGSVVGRQKVREEYGSKNREGAGKHLGLE